MSSIWSTIKRHKGKLFIATAGIGGFVYLNRFLSSVEKNWEKSASKDFVSEVRKKDTHYENSIRTCNQTCLSLSSKILENLDSLLDSDVILEELNKDPTKLVLWNDLSIVIFTRAASEVYTICLFACYLRVQLLVIAGYIYVANCTNDSHHTINHKIQLQYLSLLHIFYEKGIVDIVKPIKAAVRSSLNNISLKDQLTAKDLDKLFDQIKQRVSLNLKGNTSRFLMNPEQIQQMVDETSSDSSVVSQSGASILKKLMDETQDVLETEDFGQALNATIEIGFSHLMDLMLQCFIKNPSENGTSDSGEFTNPNTVGIPLAQLLPKMRKVLAGRTSVEQKQSLVQEILCQDTLNCYSANVYEAFCEDKN